MIIVVCIYERLGSFILSFVVVNATWYMVK